MMNKIMMNKITLKDKLPLRNDRDLFQYVKHHLINQRKRATLNSNDDGQCAYRGSTQRGGIFDGTYCAIGCLIDDEHYGGELEGLDADCPIVRAAISASNPQLEITWKTRELITVLQRVHDSVLPKHWRLVLDPIEDPIKELEGAHPDGSEDMYNFTEEYGRELTKLFLDPYRKAEGMVNA